MSARQPKKQRKLADCSLGLPFSPEQLQCFLDELGLVHLSSLSEQEQQELVVSEVKKLKAERCEANHGDHHSIDCGVYDEEMIWDASVKLLSANFLTTFITSTGKLLAELVNNPDTQGRVAAALRSDHRLLALGGSALMALLQLRSWREAMEAIGLDAAHAELRKTPAWANITMPSFLRGLFHGALQHRSYPDDVIIKLNAVVACYYGIKIPLMAALGGRIPSDVADAYGWVYHQSKLGIVASFSKMWNADGDVADGYPRRFTFTDYDGLLKMRSFESMAELSATIYEMYVGSTDVLRAYSPLHATDDQLESMASNWVVSRKDQSCTAPLAPGARQWTVEKFVDGSWLRECGREGWSPYISDEINKILKQLVLIHPIRPKPTEPRGEHGYPLQTRERPEEAKSRAQLVAAVQAAKDALKAAVEAAAARMGSDEATMAIEHLGSLAATRRHRLDAEFEPEMQEAMQQLCHTMGGEEHVLACAERYVNASFRLDQHEVRPEVIGRMRGGETVRAAHETAPEKRSQRQQQIVDDCAEGGERMGEIKRAAAAARTADREKRGVEPRWNGNTEERAAYHAAQNAKHKEQAQADMERLLAPLLPASSKSGERTILLEAIKEEIEDPPQQGKGVYIKFNMIRYFLNAHGVAAGKTLPDARGRFVSLLKERYGISIDDSKNRKRPEIPSDDDASAPKTKKQKK